jgi:UDP-GlcNAc3NAcA epimerase
MKLTTIIGARPQFIKASVINKLIREEKYIKEVLIHTGQHSDANMSDIFFNELGIDTPSYNLQISGGSHGYQTGKMIIDIETILEIEKPDYVLLYGDTNSTLAGAIAASKLYLPIIHIESGLRSYNNFMPEEINRVIVDRVSNILITPSRSSTENLIKEGIKIDNIYQFGDIMFDAILNVPKIDLDIKFDILCTIHRPINTDNRMNLELIVNFLVKTSRSKSILLLLHPRTKNKLAEFNLLTKLQNSITIRPASGYFETINLLRNCDLFITDSGGMQKEAFYCRKNTIVLRDETEWNELIEERVSILMPISNLFDLDISKLSFSEEFSTSIYGNGNTGKLILQLLHSLESNN